MWVQRDGAVQDNDDIDASPVAVDLRCNELLQLPDDGLGSPQHPCNKARSTEVVWILGSKSSHGGPWVHGPV